MLRSGTLLAVALCASCAPPAAPTPSLPAPPATSPSPPAPPPPAGDIEPAPAIALPPPLGEACLKVILAPPAGAPQGRGGGLRDPVAGPRVPEEDSPCARQDAADCASRCEGGSARACKMLGDLHFQGIGAAADPLRSQLLYERACGLGDLVGCTSAGVAYERGHPWSARPADAGCAEALFGHACDRGEPQGCWMLGSRYARDPERAQRGRALLLKTCEAGIEQACEEARRLSAPPVAR